ncbi:MAG: hypothetical protein A2X36_10860 [Elusimicrobia bacterium GWA2_69_24]|nr:MAG: hypothetical protein A2X36_10860 [Elusimicrobia bacterium GWA2_69_24]HBL18367.1 hypothetical protein [Elusimicrobiota bacterium]
MLKEEDDLSWYARKADSLRGEAPVPCAPADPAAAARSAALLAELSAGGIRGSIADRTLYTRRLPPGCRGCLAGRGTNCYVTGLCTRECFFCFNEQPRTDQLVLHGIRIEDPGEAREIVERYGLRSVGLSGGEPLLFPDRVLALLRVLRSGPHRCRVDLYTNGDRADDETLRRLKEAGLDSVRFNLAANGFDTAPVERALRYFPETTVEVPVIPDRLPEYEAMALKLDGLGVPYLNIHELFACRENAPGVAASGFSAKSRSADLTWMPTAEGEEAALRLLLFSLRRARTLSVYYCSCRTQELIGRRGLARRRSS